LTDGRVKELSGRGCESAELVRINVLIQCCEDRGHDQDEAAHDEHEREGITHHRHQDQQQLRDVPDNQEVRKKPQPANAQYEYHKVVNDVLVLRYQQLLRLNTGDELNCSNVEEGAEAVHNGPLVQHDFLLGKDIVQDLEQQLQHQPAREKQCKEVPVNILLYAIDDLAQLLLHLFRAFIQVRFYEFLTNI
jgi:hypothetical protein